MSYKLIERSEKPSFIRFVKRTFGLDLLKGLKITFIEMFIPKTIATIKYPLEKIPLSTRYRAIHKLMRLLESGNERCIGCGLCEKICISNCIKIETGYGADSRKKITSYTINFGRCIYCGLCAEVCPEIAIIHGERYENATEQRAHFANKNAMLTPLDLALRGDICEFDGYGAVSENADESVKLTPTGYVVNSSDSSLRENERSEFAWQSKSSDLGPQGESMTQRRIDADSLQVSDSSKVQNRSNGLPRFGVAESRNGDSTNAQKDS